MASVRFSRMQVRTSRSARPFARAWRTPLVAMAARLVRLGQLEQGLVGRLVRAPAMALDVDDEMIAVEDRARARASRAASGCRPEGLDAGHGDQALGVLAVEGGQVERAFALGDARLHVGDQAAELPIAGAVLGEQGQGAPALQGQLGADEGADAGVARGLEEPRRAGDAVTIDEGEGLVAELRRRARPAPRAATSRGGTRSRRRRGARGTWTVP